MLGAGAWGHLIAGQRPMTIGKIDVFLPAAGLSGRNLGCWGRTDEISHFTVGTRQKRRVYCVYLLIPASYWSGRQSGHWSTSALFTSLTHMSFG